MKVLVPNPEVVSALFFALSVSGILLALVAMVDLCKDLWLGGQWVLSVTCSLFAFLLAMYGVTVLGNCFLMGI